MLDINLLDDVEVKLIDSMGTDASIAQAARVSLAGENESVDTDKDAGLINYLMREKHGSPFEHTALKFYVKAPIFVFREFQRHRIASYNEMSGRYTKLQPDFYVPKKSRPLRNVGTSSAPKLAPGYDGQIVDINSQVPELYQHAWEVYEHLLESGIANEVARIVLPVGIYSQMYVTMNLRALFNFLSLRTAYPDAAHVSRPQHEIELVARKIEEYAEVLYPAAFEAFNKNERVAP